MIEDGIYSKILLIDKPIEWTSFDVVKRVRSMVKKKYRLTKLKVGHCGTLDPLATGLLVLFIGKKTKEIVKYQNLTKRYNGTIKIGCTTKSFDGEKPEENHKNYDYISKENINDAFGKFQGPIHQYPPIFSAVKINGEALYKKARRGDVNIELKKRLINIFELKILTINLPYITFSVKCSKGTYIRSLAHDIGQELKCGGYLHQLNRVEIGKLKLDNATSINSIHKHI